MREFVSTRNVKDIVSSKQAIIEGLAKDGGLYTPLDLSDIKVNIKECIDMDYQQLATHIISLIFNDFTKEEIKECVFNAYGNTFSDSEVTPLSKIGKNYLLELYHGPTSAFKDVALTLLPHLLKTAYKSHGLNSKVYILTATSGDTGKAALEGFKNIEDTFITVFYPKNGVSEIQEKQMNTTLGNNVEVVSIVGNFDDCQRLVKNIYESKEVSEHCKNVQLSSANSINIGRLVPQIVYYFKAYADLLKTNEIKENEKVNFVVPTGNFGNILAGYLAKQLGCPIEKLVCASNSNNVLTDFINTGVYDRNREFYSTISPSMDILVSSNLERLLFILSDYDDAKIKGYMEDLKTKGVYQVDSNILDKIKENFVAMYANDETSRKVIKEAFVDDNRLIDPHTAIAYYASKKFDNGLKNIVLSTASPYKFSNSVFNAITDTFVNNEFQAMNELNKFSNEEIPSNLKNIVDLEVLHNKTINFEQGMDLVIERIKKLNND